MIQILYKHSLLIPSKNSGKTGALAGAFVKRATDQQPHPHPLLPHFVVSFKSREITALRPNFCHSI